MKFKITKNPVFKDELGMSWFGCYLTGKLKRGYKSIAVKSAMFNPKQITKTVKQANKVKRKI